MIEVPDKVLDLLKEGWPHFACILTGITFLVFRKQNPYKNRE